MVAERRNLINRLRAIPLELGIDAILANEDTTLLPRLRQLVGELRAEWRELDAKIEALNGELVELAHNDAAARRLKSIPAVGVINATALIAAVGDASSFAKARDLGAWLGLVPRQHTTGGKPRLLGISKRGNTYLRTLLNHGACAALPSLARSETPLGRWLTGMIERGVHRNAIVVALANKLARIAWPCARRAPSSAAIPSRHMYFEDRHIDTLHIITDAWRQDLSLSGDVLREECASVYFRGWDNVPVEQQGNL